MKKLTLKSALLINLSAILCAVSAQAENVFIDCSVPNEQCNMLYQSPNAYDASNTKQTTTQKQVVSVAPIARTSTSPLAVSQPYVPQNETLILVDGKPVVQKTVAAPQPLSAPTVASLSIQAPAPVAVSNNVYVTENGVPVVADEAFVAPTIATTENDVAASLTDEMPVVVVSDSAPTNTTSDTSSAQSDEPKKVEALAPSETFKTTGEIPEAALPILKSSEIAPPYVEKEPVQEYNVKDVPDGSVITQKETTVHKNADGSIIEVSRVKETIVSPRKVDLPAISDVQRTHKIAYGTSVHDWQAPKGETLRTLLTDWGDKSGWTIVWQLERDYVLEAGVVFRGTFTDVASAILRTFARAMPAPVGTFFNGNRVLLITTQEDDNAQ
jgi:hypothetical protein